MRSLLKILRLLNRQERRKGAYVLLMVIGMALLEVGGIASVMPFLAVLGDPDMIGNNPILKWMYTKGTNYLGVANDNEFLTLLGIISFLVIAASSIYRVLTLFILNNFIELSRHSIGSRLLETYLRQPYEFFLHHHSGDMSKAVLSEVDLFIHQVLRPVIMMLAYTGVFMGLIILLIAADPKLALIVAVTFGGLYLLIYFIVKGYLERAGNLRTESNKERFLMASEAFGGIKNLKLLGCEGYYLGKFKAASHKFSKVYAIHQTLNQTPKFLVEAVAFGGILLLTLVLLNQYGGETTGALGHLLPMLGLYAFTAYRIQPATTAIYQGMANLRYGRTMIDELYSDLTIEIKKEAKISSPIRLNIKEKIRLQNISFTYPKTDQKTLKNISIDIPVGSSVAFVGTTGAGKTTLIDVILGLLPATEGEIIVDEICLKRSDLDKWQKEVGYVPQDIFLTDNTVYENIAFGIEKEEINHEQVIRCAKMAQAHEFITNELSNGYYTSVGERGVRLSGGQKQRLGIARALYHDPSILILDEATSALDSVTEQSLMNAIEKLQGSKTIIIIAHRLGTVRKCNKVVLLESGCIKAEGSFEELSESNPHFKAMVIT